MTLSQIKYVLTISRYGSISKAAEVLCLTQPYLSNVLKDLENELHIEIFERGRKGVKLTDEGKLFLQYARPMLIQEEKIAEIYNSKKQRTHTLINISTQRYSFVIKAFMEFFESLNPDSYEIHLRETGMDTVIRDVYEQHSEVGIIFISRDTENFIKKYLEVRNIEYINIASVYPHVFFRRDHPMALYDEIDLNDMSKYPFVSFESNREASMDFAEEVLMLDLNGINKRFYVIDRTTMINIVTHTDAFSIGTGILSKGYAGSESVSRPIKGHGRDIRLVAIKLKSHTLSPDIKNFLDSLNNVLSDYK